MWHSVVNFAIAVGRASAVVFLFVSAVLITGSLSLVLLSGKYTSGDVYTDDQFRDYLQCCITMFIYLATGANYVEAVSPSLSLPGATFCTRRQAPSLGRGAGSSPHSPSPA